MLQFCYHLIVSSIRVKKRINISVSPEVNEVIHKLAERDSVTTTTKALELIKKAIQIEEDEVWEALVLKRDSRKAKYYSHQEAW